MNGATPPAGELYVTQFLVVSDQDRSREFYQSVFGADVVRDHAPVILALANTRIVLNVGGGPTDDKPTVRLAPPTDADVSSGFLNFRVRDIAKAYRDWSARGATFLTEPKDHGYEIRAYIRDPDGHLIEVARPRERRPPGRIRVEPSGRHLAARRRRFHQTVRRAR